VPTWSIHPRGNQIAAAVRISLVLKFRKRELAVVRSIQLQADKAEALDSARSVEAAINMFISSCSPTRAALLTGRNHHSVGFGVISEIATGFPATMRHGAGKRHDQAYPAGERLLHLMFR